MSRMVLLVVAVLVVPGVAQAQAPKYVQISGVVGGAQLAVKATNQGGNYVGVGKLTAPTGQGYNLSVRSGAVLQNRYVTLQGVILAPNGSVFTSFTLNADRTTGAILFVYTAGGNTIRQTTTGTVLFLQ